ncbi:hypothetical protein GTA08_BOTSDO01849 [Neofusicoccum parvum]|nr:hypothetical protein GTA08_BOTSDO01849 [Neofusicoccum parvum]
MRGDLDLAVGTRHSTVSPVFYPTFILFQIPVVPTIRHVGPGLYLTGAPTAFGARTVGGGFVTTWTEMVARTCLMAITVAIGGCVLVVGSPDEIEPS